MIHNGVEMGCDYCGRPEGAGHVCGPMRADGPLSAIAGHAVPIPPMTDAHLKEIEARLSEREGWSHSDQRDLLAEVHRLRERPECGATCESGPYAGVVCTLGVHRGVVEHEAWALRPGRRFELLETWW